MTTAGGAQATKKYLPWFIWGIAALFYCYENFLQVSLNVIGPDIIKFFDLSTTDLGILASFYFYTYAAMQIPVGMMLDRLGPRIILTMAASVVAIGCLLFGMAEVFSLTILGRLLIGFGSAFAIVSCFKLASTWFALERFAFLSGLTITVGFSGSIFGEYPLALLVEALGWRTNMISYSVIGLLLTFLLWRIVRNTPEPIATAAHSSHTELGLRQGLKLILASRTNWLTALYGSFMFAPTIVLGSSWGGMFMMSAYHISRPTAVGIISAIYFGWIIGGPLFGFISDLMRRRKPVLLIASAGAFVTLTPVLYYHHFSLFIVGTLFFLFGLFSSGFLPSFSIIREMNNSKLTATAMGFMNTMNSLGGVFAPYFIGHLLDWHWSGLFEHGVRAYSVSDFHFALLMLPIILGLSLLLLPLIPETHCNSHDV